MPTKTLFSIISIFILISTAIGTTYYFYPEYCYRYMTDICSQQDISYAKMARPIGLLGISKTANHSRLGDLLHSQPREEEARKAWDSQQSYYTSHRLKLGI
jgi:hypothetical protein